MTPRRPDPRFWAGRRVLVTGHTGFKGAWLCLLLNRLGAQVCGVALPPAADGAYAAMRPRVSEQFVDIRDSDALRRAVRRADPEIVLHLAAQALVGAGYAHPVETFAVNVMGTAHLLEAAAHAAAILVVTSDKVYRHGQEPMAFHEDSPLGGADPYSASKAAAELVVASWRTRLAVTGCRVATARAGNVLGGGDRADGRLAGDVVRAAEAGVPLLLRRPDAIRPWQYVLDVLSGYLLYAEALLSGDAPAALNFGPAAGAMIPAAELAERLLRALGYPATWQSGPAGFAEAAALRLDSTRAWEVLGWRAATPLDQALAWTADWQRAAWSGADMAAVGTGQIAAWLRP